MSKLILLIFILLLSINSATLAFPIGLQRKLLPFGTAVKVSESRYSYHISAAQFCDYMGLTPEELIALKY